MRRRRPATTGRPRAPPVLALGVLQPLRLLVDAPEKEVREVEDGRVGAAPERLLERGTRGLLVPESPLDSPESQPRLVEPRLGRALQRSAGALQVGEPLGLHGQRVAELARALRRLGLRLRPARQRALHLVDRARREQQLGVVREQP